MENVSRELRILEHRRELLKRRYGPISSPEERARILQTECEMIEKSQIYWLTEIQGMSRENAVRLLKDQLVDLSREMRGPMDFSTWAENYYDTLCRATANHSFRCSKYTCIHYIYGFSAPEELLKHLEVHHNQNSSSAININREDNLLQDQPLMPRPDILDNVKFDTDFVYVSFDCASGPKPQIQSQPIRPRKHKRRTRNGDGVIKSARQNQPCLRCKVLKKECDGETPCKQCPQRTLDKKADHWKVLGCLRALPRSLARTFVPVLAVSRVWYYMLNQGAPSVTKSQDFVTFTNKFKYLQTLHSYDKFLKNISKPRHDLREVELMKWLPEVWALFKIQGANQGYEREPALDICILYQNSILVLNTLFEIEMVGLAILLLERKNFPLRHADLPVSSFKPGANIKNRAPNALCGGCQRRKSRCVFHAGQTACVLCQFHSEVCSFVCTSQPRSENSNVNGTGALATFHGTGDSIYMRDALCHLFKSIESFLSTAFSERFCRRKSLAPKDWLQIFASLCSFSILMSLLIDAHTAINISDDETQAGIAVRINSAYKALVSIFTWAAKSDLLVEWYGSAELEDGMLEAEDYESFKTLCQLVQRGEWENRGIKSSKDFLMGLGSGFYNDGTYSGFYIQRFGLKEPRKSKDASLSHISEDSIRHSEASSHRLALEASYLRGTDQFNKRSETGPKQVSGHFAQEISTIHNQRITASSSIPSVAPTADRIDVSSWWGF